MALNYNHHRTLQHFLPVRHLRARPRLFASIALACLTYALLPASVTSQTTTRLLLTWNTGIFFYLLLAAIMLIRSPHEHIHVRADAQDEGKIVVLATAVLATLACLVAIFFELTIVRKTGGNLQYAHIALALITVTSSWLFIHLMFALHYAHDFFLNTKKGIDGGLQFPGTEHPDYFDFLYFAAIIGTSGQTADVSFSSQPMRRIGTVHCVLAYVFNTTVLALTINIASGLL